MTTDMMEDEALLAKFREPAFSRGHRNPGQALTVLCPSCGRGTPTERRRPMTSKPTFPRSRKIPPTRNPERYRFRALDDFGDELLDDWMVACPAADLARSD
jgi:hypothetical protein